MTNEQLMKVKCKQLFGCDFQLKELKSQLKSTTCEKESEEIRKKYEELIALQTILVDEIVELRYEINNPKPLVLGVGTGYRAGDWD